MKRKLNKRSVALLVSLAVILTAAVGVTLAYIFTNTDALQNIFTPAQVSCAVVENGSTTENKGNIVYTGDIKSNVQIKNTGDTDAYIRVAVVITWKSADGTKVWAQKPVEGTDYSITYPTDTDWVEGADGYYYYTKSVPPTDGSDLTGILINEAKQLKPCSQEGYYLSIEIVASAIQASPDNVVGSQWSNEKVTITASNGTLSVVKKED